MVPAIGPSDKAINCQLGSLAACAETGLGDVKYLLGINIPNKCRKEKAGGGAYKSQGADALPCSVTRSVYDWARVATERLLPSAGPEDVDGWSPGRPQEGIY